MLVVVCGIMARNGRFFAAKRPLTKSNGGLWEFPGGKVEPGETKEQALKREFEEELGLVIAIEKSLPAVTWRSINLHSFLVTEASGQLTLYEHDEIGWFSFDQLKSLSLCSADRLLLEKLCEGQLSKFGKAANIPVSD